MLCHFYTDTDDRTCDTRAALIYRKDHEFFNLATRKRACEFVLIGEAAYTVVIPESYFKTMENRNSAINIYPRPWRFHF